VIQQPPCQVHLDFHTSEAIPAVGSRFSRENWQEALRLGNVQAINIFAKCHHGWSYYPTAVGAPHPALRTDLLGTQIEACHEMGVRCPIYYTVGWSARDARMHPEWCVRDAEGGIVATDPALAGTPDPEAKRPPVSWIFLCPSGEYRRLMLAQTEEICARYPVDGLWYDICAGPVCRCPACRAGMAEAGLDPAREEEAAAYNHAKWRSFMEECNAVLRRRHPEATVFYNGTTVMHEDGRHTAAGSEYHTLNSHYELEDLPTTWGGYDKLSLRSKHFIRYGKPIIAMSGKFHTSWGEFGGFKHREAIRYEAAAMLAHGAACCFGDQLHPLGEMELCTYRNIGFAYEYVRELSPYCLPATPFATLGLWRSGSEPDDQGTVNMLLESHRDFVVVDEGPASPGATPGQDPGLSDCEVVVLPGARCLSPEQARRLQRFVEKGGGLLILGESILSGESAPEREAAAGGAPGEPRMLFDVGASYEGPPRFEQDYTLLPAGSPLRGSPPAALSEADVPESPFLNYRAALRVRPRAEAEVLAHIHEPYFDRSYARYCSHQNTPYRPERAGHPAALRRGRVLFLAHRLGALYHAHGARVHRELFAAAVRLLHTRPALSAALPSAGRLTLMHQPQHRRYVAHLLYAPPLLRGRCLLIEDLPPLHGVPLRLRVPQPVRRAYLAPGKRPLRLSPETEVTVPELRGHQAVVFEY
jgi:hypothetical protein